MVENRGRRTGICGRAFSGVRGYSGTFSRGGFLPHAAWESDPKRSNTSKIEHSFPK